MSDRIDIEVDLVRPVALVRIGGELDARTAVELRAALIDCLIEQPVGIVVDVAELLAKDDSALTVLAAVAQEGLRWPGAAIVIAGASPELAALLERDGITDYVAVYPDRETALGELGKLPEPPTVRYRITPDRDAPAHARMAVRELCEATRMNANIDAAYLIVSELVTNAVVHATTAIDVTLRLLPPLLHIAVRDSSADRPRMAAYIDESSESGRGLLLVDALASQWGTLGSPHGKVVWATVVVRGAPPFG